MKVALLYPPPWKIPARGEAVDTSRDGPPGDVQPGDLDADFFQLPYGLLSLGAEALRAGHQVKVLNLSGFAWTHVEGVLGALDADVYGMSCWTANRRGVALVADLVKRLRPRATVVVGGPHATPLAEPMLRHHPSVDVVCLGESEATFLELLARLERGRSLEGLAGAVVRAPSGLSRGPERPSIEDLDTLCAPQAYFASHIVMTSRGCPWACTFCGADTTWGRGFRGHSVAYTLDLLERALERLPVKMLQVKDDTFTTNRRRVLSLCEGILARGLRFEWSCDTRVDVLSDELLRAMRLAGCRRLSLGVESGSREVLARIDKKITPEKILQSAELARRYGIQVRFYMMVGNRGETRETLEETWAFLQRARPHQYLFSCLSIYPGTRDYHDAVAAGWLSPEVYFTGDFQEFKVPFDAPPEDVDFFEAFFQQHKGLRTLYRESAEECRAILARLGDHAGAHLDLACALLREGDPEGAEASAARALTLGHALPGLCHNALACAASARGDHALAARRLADALDADPQHPSVLRNFEALKPWLDAGGASGAAPPRLSAESDFQLLERTAQPCLPGPLPLDFAQWTPAEEPRRQPPLGPSESARRRLRLVTA
ncbi:MAG: B12-binding domain-containing radical SAM protein [Deltaproteobacteria bacterium]|nr:B12-binding domain-containing radical SAM protein [Deltaproteobacteria bacterium]